MTAFEQHRNLLFSVAYRILGRRGNMYERNVPASRRPATGSGR
ncbi:hypothetical protein [Actinoplanes sp. NPDC020271]